jgi:hypothetical protein
MITAYHHYLSFSQKNQYVMTAMPVAGSCTAISCQHINKNDSLNVMNVKAINEHMLDERFETGFCRGITMREFLSTDW